MNCKVSVIIPCYSVEKYLDRCLNSVINQTYQYIEIILVDDGSTDSTPTLCDEWATKDSRIRVIHKANDGLANARNTGIEICTGDYVMFVDSDDYIEPDMVEFLLNLAVQYNADVSRCGYYYDYDNGEIMSFGDDAVKMFNDTDRMIDLISQGNISGVAWNKLYRRDVILSHPYDKADGCSEDIMHNFRVYQDVKTTVFCDIPKYHYVENGASITHSKFGYGAFDIIRARNIMLDYFKDNEDILPYAQEWYIRSAYIVLSGCIQSNACMDRYDELRAGILRYKGFILNGSRFKQKIKLRTLLLWLCPTIYNAIVKSRG